MMKWLWLSVFVVVLDQLTKYLAVASLTLGGPSFELLPFLDFTLSYNKGAAFSFLSEAGGWQRFFFIGLAAFIVTILGIWLKKLRAEERWIAIALTMVMGGAVGNVIDRVWREDGVVDFIHFFVGDWHFPIFNIADIAISVGVFLLIVDALFGKEHKDS